jgi:hypothetical protein
MILHGIEAVKIERVDLMDKTIDEATRDYLYARLLEQGELWASHTATICCSRTKREVSSQTYANYGSTTTVTNYTINTFKLPFDFHRTYDKVVECPICKKELTLRVKTKDNIPEDIKMEEIKGNSGTLKACIIGFLVTTLILVSMVALSAKMSKDAPLAIIALFAGSVVLLTKIFKYARYVKHPEEFLNDYEEKNRYFIMLPSDGHTIMNGTSEASRLTWADIPKDGNI